MPLLWLSLAFLIGVALAASLPFGVLGWLTLAGGVIFLRALRLISLRIAIPTPRFVQRFNQWFARVFDHFHLGVPFLGLLLALALGGIRFELRQPDLSDPNYIAAYNDNEVLYQVEGLLQSPLDLRDRRADLRLQVERLTAIEQGPAIPVAGLLLARTWEAQDWHYGDRLRLQGYLKTPESGETFDYRRYLAQQGIYSTMQAEQIELLASHQGNLFWAWLYALKERALATLYQLYPDPEASLIAGILLGVESGIPAEVERAFQNSGTAHIIAISGFNIALLSGLFTALFSRLLGRWRGALVALGTIAAYTLLVGAGASVVRAALMGGLTLFATQLGRRQVGLNTLGFVAAVMALFNPYVLWDVGFQLSFAATLGLVLYAEPLTNGFLKLAGRWLPAERAQILARPVGEYLLFTFAATLTTLPIIAYHFQRLSLVSLLANPFILPAQPPLMILGGLSLLAGLVSLPLAKLAALIAWIFAAYSVRLAEFFAAIPGSVLTLGQISLVWIVVFYAALFGLTFFGGKLRAWLAERAGGSRWATLPWLALGGLGIAAVLVWRVALNAPDGKLHLTVLEVGSGDGLLIQTPAGRYLLIDGGPSITRLADAMGRRLPAGQRLDWLVVAASGEEQVAALPPLIERSPPHQVLWAGAMDGTQAARRLQEQLNQAGIEPIALQTGHNLDLGEGAWLRTLAVGRRGAVLLLEWGDFRALLPMGIDFDLLDNLQADPRLNQITAFLLADSGYAPSNPPEWIEKLHPQVTLLSVAAGDREGRPDPDVLDALKDYTLLRTDRDGWIELTTDGEQLWVEVEKLPQ